MELFGAFFREHNGVCIKCVIVCFCTVLLYSMSSLSGSIPFGYMTDIL